MLIRIFKLGILGTLVQLIIYWIIFLSIQEISTLLTSGRTQFLSDLAFVYSIGLFGFILLFQNIITAILNRKPVYLISACATSLLIAVAWVEDISSWPYQTICFIGISVFVIFNKFAIDKLLNRYLTEVKPNA